MNNWPSLFCPNHASRLTKKSSDTLSGSWLTVPLQEKDALVPSATCRFLDVTWYDDCLCATLMLPVATRIVFANNTCAPRMSGPDGKNGSCKSRSNNQTPLTVSSDLELGPLTYVRIWTS